MVAVIDDAYAFVDVLTDDGGTGSDTGNALVITVNGGVVVSQQVVADVVNMLVVSFTIVSLSCTFVFRNALSDGQPGVSGAGISLVVDDFVDLRGHMGLVLCRETADDNVVIQVISCHLSIHIVTLAAIAAPSASCGK